jgi:hypothetical protein
MLPPSFVVLPSRDAAAAARILIGQVAHPSRSRIVKLAPTTRARRATTSFAESPWTPLCTPLRTWVFVHSRTSAESPGASGVRNPPHAASSAVSFRADGSPFNALTACAGSRRFRATGRARASSACGSCAVSPLPRDAHIDRPCHLVGALRTEASFARSMRDQPLSAGQDVRARVSY